MTNHGLFIHLSIGILKFDQELKVTWVSDQFLTLFEADKQAMLSKNINQIISPNDNKGQINFYSQLLQYKEGIIDCQITLNLNNKDFFTRIRIIRLQKDWVFFIEDLLKNKNLTFQLLWEEKKFSNIVQHSGEGIVILDNNLKVLEFNRKFFELMDFRSEHGIKLTEAALEGKELFGLIGQQFDDLKTIISNAELNHTFSYKEVVKVNSKQYIEIQHTPTIMPVKGITGHCIIFKDISTQKLLEKLTLDLNYNKTKLESTLNEIKNKNKILDRLNEEKNELVSMVAHDLKSPLNQIEGLVGLMIAEKGTLSKEHLKYTKKIQDSVITHKNLITKILSKRTADLQEPNIDFADVNIGESLNYLIDINLESATRKGIEIKKCIDSNAICQLDINYTEQIFQNLISNAIKFSPINTVILINVWINSNTVIVEIIDEGPGFSEDESNLVFKEFRKFSNKSTGGEDSNGIGLSIVKKYTEYMHGKVWCESVQDQGAKFIVEFPKKHVQLRKIDNLA